jgi:hypothetical protein
LVIVSHAGIIYTKVTPLWGRSRKRKLELTYVALPIRQPAGPAAKVRWREGLTAAKMAVCRWRHPFIVAQVEFLE